jgi:hypothetical protein
MSAAGPGKRDEPPPRAGFLQLNEAFTLRRCYACLRLDAPHPRDGEYAGPGDQHRGPMIRAVLRQILETGDVVGTDTSGRVVITLAVDAWPLNKLGGLRWGGGGPGGRGGRLSPDSPGGGADRAPGLTRGNSVRFSDHVREGPLSGKYRLVEEVVSFIRHQSSRAKVWILVVTAGCGRYASRGAYPLDINGLREPGPPSRAWLRSHHLEQEPGNRICLNETGIGGRCDRIAPYSAGILGLLPSGTGQVLLIWVGTQKMGDDLPPEFEQGRLWPEKGPAKARLGEEA